MKKMTNFRLDQETLALLEQLSKDLGKSKTDVVQEAVGVYYTKKKKRNPHPLLKLAGSVPSDEMEEVMKIIEEERKKFKLIDVDL